MTASLALRPVITDRDDRRLRDLLVTPIGRLDPRGARILSRRIEEAEVVASASVAPTVITMTSRVSCRREATGTVREMTLVYPWHAAPESGRISVMTELGADLLGASIGHTIALEGEPWCIASVLYQPESEANAAQ